LRPNWQGPVTSKPSVRGCDTFKERFLSEPLRCAELDITDTMAFIQERRTSALLWIKRIISFLS